uniref:Uncharacterized protein n=1 Tax=Oryza punctata TaxID=4537 RepID=A0A0E0KY68_ORYPU
MAPHEMRLAPRDRNLSTVKQTKAAKLSSPPSPPILPAFRAGARERERASSVLSPASLRLIRWWIK